MASDNARSMKRPIRVAELASSDIQSTKPKTALTPFWKLTGFHKLVIVAFPVAAYGFWHMCQQKRLRYNFELHQSRIFKETISIIGSNSSVRDVYGENMQLKPASIWTAGYMPWLKEKHIWIGFSGDKLDGWIRMGLRRSDFETSKEIVSGIKNDIYADIEADKIKAYEMKAGFEYLKDSRDSAKLEDLRQKTTSPPTKTVPESVQPTVLSSEPPVLSSEPPVLSSEPTVLSSEPTILSSKPIVLSSEPTILSSEPIVLCAEGDKVDKFQSTELQTIADLVASDLPESEKNHLTQEATVRYRRELKEKYPTLPTDYSKLDIEQAMKIERQRKLVDTFFNKIWDLSTVSVHPLDLNKKEDVFVLYDPHNNYHDQDQYLFDSSFFSKKKPSWMTRTKEVTNKEVTNKEVTNT